jgi:predicted dehydrogenase/sugar phosphate isomerase/epimerase
MFLSVFTDELGMDIAEALPVIKGWGLEHVDLRGRVFGSACESLPPQRLPELRSLLGAHEVKVACLESSLAKVHLPDADTRKAEAEKLEGIIRAADALDCRLVRSFFYWQPPRELEGQLAVRPDEQQKVLDAFAPLAERAKKAGLILAFENCGVTPEEVLTVLEALGVASWGLAWDVRNGWDGDWRRRDEDGYVRALAQKARLLHVKADGAVEGVGQAAEPVPYRKVLDICHRAGLRGPVSVETHNPDRSVSSDEMSRRVVEAVRKAWPTAAPGGLFDEPHLDAVRRAWTDKPVGFVVVGLGMGHSRAKQVHETSGCRLIGVCDDNEQRAKRSAEEYGVPCTTDVRPWLADPAVEAVYVMTETGNHAKVALAALEAGKHVLVTKPMEASLDACDRMIRLAEKKGLLLGVDFGRRYTPEVLSLRQAVRGQRFGRLLSGDCTLKILRTMDYFQSNGGWRGTRKLDGGGVLSNQSIHHIDEIAFCVGLPAKVRCDVWTQNHEIEAEDLGSAAWLYDNGMVITFRATTSYPHSTWYLHWELEGTAGAYFHAGGGPFDTPVTRYFLDGAWSDLAPDVAASEWLHAADNFAAAVRTGAELTANGREGRRTQAILDAMYRSANDRGGRWVEVEAELK